VAEATPDVLRISDAYRARLRTREAQAVRKMTAREATRLAEEVGTLRQAGEAVPPWKVVQIERYRDLVSQAQAELGRLGDDGARMIADLQREGLALGMDMAEAQVGAMIPPGVGLTFNRLPIGALESMIGFLQDGSPLARLLGDLGEETARSIGELLRDGIGLGWNPRKVARAITQKVGMALTRSLRIARTEMLRAWRRSSVQGYRDQGSLIKGYRRHAQQDDRTCIACLLMDGTFYETADEFTDHVQGRCAVVPVTRTWAELGFAGIEDTNAEWEPGREWFLRQDEGVQRSILGDPIYDAWQGGEIGLDDMKTLHESAEWGDSWGASSLVGALRNAGK
jgi:hypothetical protein